MANKNKRGWFGDSAGHAEAGRKGGRANSRNQDSNSSELGNRGSDNQDQGQGSRNEDTES